MQRQLEKGDRIVKTGPKNTRNNGATGTVVGYCLKDMVEGIECYYVVLDKHSLMSKQGYHIDFLQKITSKVDLFMTEP